VRCLELSELQNLLIWSAITEMADAVKLISADGKEYEVAKSVIELSVTVKNMLSGALLCSRNSVASPTRRCHGDGSSSDAEHSFGHS